MTATDETDYTPGNYTSDIAQEVLVLLKEDPTTVVRVVLHHLREECHRIATSRGWHEPDKKKTVGDDIALMHSELSEALEEFRAGKEPAALYYGEPNKKGMLKPEGIPSEMADVLIRIMDFSKEHEVDIGEAVNVKMQFNEGREYRHGEKKL